MFRSIINAIRNYFIATSFHGLRFIAEDGRHWTERILWVALCLMSWLGSAILIIGSWEAFQTSAVSFVVETSYLNTNTSFPSVSVCEDGNLQKIYDSALEIWGEDHDNNLDEILKELSYFKGEAYYVKEFCFSGELDCPKDNYYDLINKARSTCDEILRACYWKGKSFDCCKHFIKIETEIGPCFMFSKPHERKLWKRHDPDYIATESSRELGLASLLLEINVPTQVYIHSESERPYFNTLSTDIVKTVETPRDYKYGFVTTDIENPPEVRELSVNQRQCRFPDENYLETADEYAYSSCEVNCRKREQLLLCNCTSHLMPKTPESQKCDIKGILCLNNNAAKYIGQKTKWGVDKEGLPCDCLPGCNDAQYNIIISSAKENLNNYSTIELYLDRFPSERYKRNVVRTRLDLVVSMGGAAGLFVGASLLSFVEIFYIFIFRSRSNDSEKMEESIQLGNHKQNINDNSNPRLMRRTSRDTYFHKNKIFNTSQLMYPKDWI